MLVKPAARSFLWYQGATRDFFPWWSAPALEAACVLDDAACFRPAQYPFPLMSDQVVAARGYAQTTLVIPAGSFIWGIMHNVHLVAFDFQVTDTQLNHELFSSPCSETLLIPSSPFFFPEPYPVVGDGLFDCEVWNTGFTAGAVEMVLLVAEKKNNAKR